MEPLRAEPAMVTSAPGVPKAQSEPVTSPRGGISRMPLRFPVPYPNEAPAIEVPGEATRLARLTRPSRQRLPKRPNVSVRDPVDQYLWEVYQRKPVKSN